MKVSVIPIVLGALESDTKSLERKLKIKGIIETILTRVLESLEEF